MIKPRAHFDKVERIKEKEPTRLFKYRLDRNERNQPFSPEFIESLKSKINGELLMVYPELEPVYAKLSNWLNIQEDKLMLNAGSEQAIKSVFETYINPGDSILLHSPSFAMYSVYAKIYQANIINQSFDSELKFDWDSYIEKINKNIRMVIVENPNGFLGTSPSLDKLRLLIQKSHENNVIVLIDEAYFIFSNETAADLIDKYDNIIIVRTFSKAFGLAGARIGYIISQAKNIDALKKVRPSYEINSLAAMIVLEMLEHKEEMESYVKDTKKNLAALRKGLLELGIASSDSKANFIAARLGELRIHDELRHNLLKHNILIRRPFREEWLKEWVRIGTAPAEIQNILLSELKKILGK